MEKRALRIGLVERAPGTADGMGAQLGAEEAARTAQLLGLSCELLRGEAARRLLAAGATAVVGGFDDRALSSLDDSGALVFAIGSPADEAEPPVHRNAFQVTATPAQRRSALARWQGKGPRTGLRVVEWHPALVRYGALELNQRYTARFHQPMAPLAWAGWVAVKAWAELSLRSQGMGDPVDHLLALRFDGHKGARLRFDPRSHELMQPLYVVGPDGRLLGEVPPEEAS